MNKHFRLRASAPALSIALLAPIAHAQTSREIVVTAETAASAPSSQASIISEQIAETINAVNVEDTVKYLPSLVVRKRHIGDTQSPLATRTSGLGASARSLIYADGVLLSSLIGNNNTSASPRWGMVSVAEIARINVLYGPFSAAYPGNSIGAVVNITTRMPERLEGTANAGVSLQDFAQYGTDRLLPAYQFGATLGDRFGPLALFASATHTISNGQPLGYATAVRPASGAGGVVTSGGYDDRNRTGQAIRVLGATGLEHQVQDNLKLKAALDLGGVELRYVVGLFRNDADSTVETYLANATGQPVYAGALNIGGSPYNVAASAFSGGVSRSEARHWSHALSAAGTGARFDWQVTATRYDFSHDVQRSPTGALPAAFAGGAGNITRLDGTGWTMLDAKGAWRAGGAQKLSAGAHWDRFAVNSNRYATADWISGSEGTLNQASRGRTQTAAVWAQDEAKIGPATLTLGGRYEWWQAFDGFNYSLAPGLSVNQPGRRAEAFSPKASLAVTPAHGWVVRLSAGKAVRFPTVGELYQAITTGTVLTVPNPDLRPERAWSQELAVEHRGAGGSARLSLFNEIVSDALIAQSAPLVAGSSALFNYVQNVGRTRARGVEAAVQWSDLPVRGVDVSGSVTYADATTRKDSAFPAAVGKLLPSVPRWKASAVVTWRPADGVSLTAAARYASRSYGTLDNSDTVGNTYQGFYRYLVVDLRASFRVAERYRFSVGVDNVGNAKYFLFHPFPQRSVSAEMGYAF